MRDVLLTPMQKFVKEDMNSDVLVRSLLLFPELLIFTCSYLAKRTKYIHLGGPSQGENR